MNRPVNSQTMKSTLAFISRPVKGVHVKGLNPNIFLFFFFHELDMQRVINEGLWTFDRQLLHTKILHARHGSSISENSSSRLLGLDFLPTMRVHGGEGGERFSRELY